MDEVVREDKTKWRPERFSSRFLHITPESYTDAKTKGSKNEKQWFHSYRRSTLRRWYCCRLFFPIERRWKADHHIEASCSIKQFFLFQPATFHFISFKIIPSSRYDPVYFIFVDVIYLDACRYLNCFSFRKLLTNSFYISLFCPFVPYRYFLFLVYFFLEKYTSLIFQKLFKNSLHSISNLCVSVNGQ